MFESREGIYSDSMHNSSMKIVDLLMWVNGKSESSDCAYGLQFLIVLWFFVFSFLFFFIKVIQRRRNEKKLEGFKSDLKCFVCVCFTCWIIIECDTN